MANSFAQKLNGYARLSESDIAALDSISGNPRRYRAKMDLIREGDPPGPVLIVLDGWASRYKILPTGARQIMALMLPGDSCDLNISMLSEMDHSIQTITPATVATVPGSLMDELLSAHPAIARAMYIARLVDEGILRSWIVSMGRRSSLERVAHLMCELYLRVREREEVQGDTLDLPLSQLVLSDALGMTPVHINRILKELRVQGAMDLKRGSLRILNPTKLVQIAGFDENYLHRRAQQRGKYS